MIEFILSMVGLVMALYAVWISSGVTSCQRELKSLERRVNALCSDVMECQIKTDKLEREAKKSAQYIKDKIIALETENQLQTTWIKTLTDRVNEQHESTEKGAKLLDTMIQEIRGELSITNVSFEELKVQLIKYQSEQQRIQSALKENGKALTKWLGGEL